MAKNKTVVISGGSSGIGKHLAAIFAQRGWYVYELSRHQVEQKNVIHLPCDITDEQQVIQSINRVIDERQEVDVLICNSGYGISGSVEFSQSESVEKQLKVNFMGNLHLVKMVLPIMRNQRQGKILFTSSLAAIFPIPFQSFYSASKAAINTFAFSLQNEVCDWGIKISVIMLGDIHTDFTANREKNELGSEVYSRMTHAVRIMEDEEQNGMQPSDVAEYFYKVATSSSPKVQYIYGWQYKLLYFVNRFLPRWTVIKILNFLYCK